MPNKRTGPAPCFVGMNFCGNHALVDDPAVRLPTAWMYRGGRASRTTGRPRPAAASRSTCGRWSSRSTAATPWPRSTAATSIPDRTKVREGIQPHIQNKDRAARLGHDRGLGAGASTGPSITSSPTRISTPSDIAVVGHSRLGKTALLAAAFDDRIALAIPHQAGCGGTGAEPRQNPKVESVKRINTSFPHWFNGTFKEFNDQPDRLPFDQHCLVALVAPRPVLFSNAVEDEWANPRGPVRGAEGRRPGLQAARRRRPGSAKKMPEPNKLIDSTLGYYIRPGKHSMTKGDWKVFLDFADKNMRP